MTSDVKPEDSKCRKYAVVGILCLINLLNYMDRYTIAGVLTDIQSFYGISDAKAGFLQTVFIVSFMLCSPICGYLGDRYNRVLIMLTGITIWICAVVASTFVPANMFWLFAVFRGIVGIGEASYITVSPTIIADLFSGNSRSRMLMVFYFAIPFGSGSGYMIGSTVASLLGGWQWGVRVTAILGVVCVVLILLFIKDPKRGGSEASGQNAETSPYIEDIKSLLKNFTYICSTLGYTAIVFVVGTMSWWVPTAVQHNAAWRLGKNSTDALPEESKSSVSLVFGAITVLGGIFGVAIGSLLAQWMKAGLGPCKYIKTQRADAIVCGVGAIIAIPTFFFGIRLIETNMSATWVLMFVCITGLCFNWAINVDLLMNVVSPSRRNTANSWQILTSHLLGDASGAYVIGLISDAVRGAADSPEARFKSLVSAFYLPNVLLCISVVFYAIAAFTFAKDRQKFLKEIGQTEKPQNNSSGKTNQAFEEMNMDS